MVGKKVLGALFSNLDKNGLLRKRKSRSESDNDDLSDIDDAEIAEYFNNNGEMLFKKMVWEAMNKDYAKRKQRKPAMEKKSTSARKVVASRLEKGKEEGKENRKRLSSKINYDALEKIGDESEEVGEMAEKGGIGWKRSNQIEAQQSNKGTSSRSLDAVLTSEEENYNEEFEFEADQNASLYYYGDEEDDQEEYGCWKDYDHEEF